MRVFFAVLLVAIAVICWRLFPPPPGERPTEQAAGGSSVPVHLPPSAVPSRPSPGLAAAADPLPDWARNPEAQAGFVTTQQKYGAIDPEHEKRYPRFFDATESRPHSQRELDERHASLFRRYASERLYDRPSFFEGHADLRDRNGRSWRLELELTFCRNGGQGDDKYEPGGFPLGEESAGYYLALRVHGPAGQGVYTHKAVIGSLNQSGGRAYAFLPNAALEKAFGITALAVELPTRAPASGDLRLRPFPSKEWSQASVAWVELAAP